MASPTSPAKGQSAFTPLSRKPTETRAMAAFAAILLAGTASLQAAFTIQLVADNDFAVLAGTSTGVSRIVYQNNVGWSSQISSASSFEFDLEPGENTFYILAMGGGGQENVSGRINGVNIASIEGVLQSNNVAGSLTNYNLSNVASGAYDAQLSDVQGIFSGLSWSSPTLSSADSIPTVISQNEFAYDETLGRRVGFVFPDSNAVLFQFSTQSVGVSPVPEPSSAMGAGALLAVGLMTRSRRHR